MFFLFLIHFLSFCAHESLGLCFAICDVILLDPFAFRLVSWGKILLNLFIETKETLSPTIKVVLSCRKSLLEEDKSTSEEDKSLSKEIVLVNREVSFGHNGLRGWVENKCILSQPKPRSEYVGRRPGGCSREFYWHG